jgi:hypothetical protein
MSTAAWQLSGLAVFALALCGLGTRILFQRRETPETHERKRRLSVNSRGRLGDGIVTDANPNAIYYSYAVAGVRYRASQDVTHLSKFLPADRDRLIGPVTLKYSPRNAANSIVVCEIWSGLRATQKESVSQ